MMKNLINILTLVTCTTILFAACDHSVLTKQPLDEMSQEDVWNDPALVEAYINDVYQGVGHGYVAVRINSGVDEAKHVHGWDDGPVRQSNLTPDNIGFFRSWANWFPHYRWDELYSKIRDTNIFLEEIDGVEMSQGLKGRLKGEAHFLRAYFYHNLMKLHGGVPLITQAFDLDDDFLVSRGSFEETIDLIVSDLDQAAQLLPVIQDNDGRATKGAALALKSRTLLFAASDLYHENIGSMPETGYMGGDQQARWRAAKNAAQEVMNLGVYELYEANPAPGDSAAENYANIFLVDGHNEHIFVRHMSAEYGWSWFEGNIGLFSGPNGYHNWGGDVPLQQHVDAYEMADGTKFSWNNPDHAENPYENRDPRFYASIFYNGAEWRERPSDVYDLDPEGIVETANFEVEGQDDLRPGLDTRGGPIEDWNGTYTGYYTRKFLDINVNHQFNMQEKPWVFIRFAEILLNYAEASVELGEDADARRALNRIRTRAGMPDVPATESGHELLERVRNERRVELAFEEHRFFDVRRWMIAPEAYENGQGVDIIGRLNDDGSYTFEYNLRDVDDRGW
ncbi:MAG: RagB/SusD family nutrient uptake outer membrane protein, partial [Balneolaceae bacterium]